jgi:hypothetical protein
MAQTILLGGFYCAAGGSMLLLCFLVWHLVLRRLTTSRKNIAAASLSKDVQARRIGRKSGFRGYDYPELCEEDLLFRIEQLQNEIGHYGRKQAS